MPKCPNLRDWQPTDGDAKDVSSTKMLNTTARETPDTVDAKSEHKETVVSHPNFGSLGAQGRC